MADLSEKTAIITGAGKGKTVAYGIACAFAQAGANLVVTGRSKGKLKAVKELEAQYGIKVLPLQLEIDGSAADETAIESVVEAAVGEFGRIDVLVNAAQAAHAGVLLAETSLSDFDAANSTGVRQAFLLMKACHPHLAAAKGNVINVVSAAGIEGQPGQSALVASKEALAGLSRVAANEWAADGIRVNMVCPLAATSALEKWGSEFPEAYEEMLASIPLGRAGDVVDDIGRAVTFLASDDAAYVTGQLLNLRGGLR